MKTTTFIILAVLLLLGIASMVLWISPEASLEGILGITESATETESGQVTQTPNGSSGTDGSTETQRKTIAFNICGYTCVAEKGSTWLEYIQSEDNTLQIRARSNNEGTWVVTWDGYYLTRGGQNIEVQTPLVDLASYYKGALYTPNSTEFSGVRKFYSTLDNTPPSGSTYEIHFTLTKDTASVSKTKIFDHMTFRTGADDNVSMYYVCEGVEYLAYEGISFVSGFDEINVTDHAPDETLLLFLCEQSY